MRAVLCPVCSGKGSIFTPNTYSTGGGETKVCHGCAGKGWVEVHDNMPQFTDYYPACYPSYSPYPDPDWWSTAAP